MTCACQTQLSCFHIFYNSPEVQHSFCALANPKEFVLISDYEEKLSPTLLIGLAADSELKVTVDPYISLNVTV